MRRIMPEVMAESYSGPTARCHDSDRAEHVGLRQKQQDFWSIVFERPSRPHPVGNRAESVTIGPTSPRNL
jgi:hypothetical protein